MSFIDSVGTRKDFFIQSLMIFFEVTLMSIFFSYENSQRLADSSYNVCCNWILV